MTARDDIDTDDADAQHYLQDLLTVGLDANAPDPSYPADFAERGEVVKAADAAGWRPIETAPRDRSAIQVWHVIFKVPLAVRYLPRDQQIESGGRACQWAEATFTTAWPEEAFSHWMPLPAPPTALSASTPA